MRHDAGIRLLGGKRETFDVLDVVDAGIAWNEQTIRVFSTHIGRQGLGGTGVVWAAAAAPIPARCFVGPITPIKGVGLRRDN